MDKLPTTPSKRDRIKTVDTTPRYVFILRRAGAIGLLAASIGGMAEAVNATNILDTHEVASTVVPIEDNAINAVCGAVDQMADEYNFDPEAVFNCVYAGQDVNYDIASSNGTGYVQRGDLVKVTVNQQLLEGLTVEAQPVVTNDVG